MFRVNGLYCLCICCRSAIKWNNMIWVCTGMKKIGFYCKQWWDDDNMCQKTYRIICKVVVAIKFTELLSLYELHYFSKCNNNRESETQMNGWTDCKKIQYTHLNPNAMHWYYESHRMVSTRSGLAVFKSKCQHINPIYKANEANTLHIVA